MTIPRGRIDEHGIEDITGIFSSPTKPSPWRQVHLYESVPQGTPTAKQSRKSTRATSLPRSASPKKAGIKGIARRSHGIDLLAAGNRPVLSDDDENALGLERMSGRPAVVGKLIDVTTKSALRDITSIGADTQVEQGHLLFRSPAKTVTDGTSYRAVPESPQVGLPDTSYTSEHGMDTEHGASYDVYDPPEFANDDGPEPNVRFDARSRSPASPILLSVEDDGTNRANSRKKRKAGHMATAQTAMSLGSPRAKKLRTSRDAKSSSVRNATDTASSPHPDFETGPNPAVIASRSKPKQVRHGPSNNSFPRQQKELEQVVERIRARPGPKKSLYVLRRETPADEGVTHTRSGRVSVKPLAYWRNERCVYGGSPNHAHIEDGARFPLNSIKEIIRTHEVEVHAASKAKAKVKRRDPIAANPTHENLHDDSSVCDDSNLEDWEKSVGVIKGSVSVWDPEAQAPLNEVDEAELAYAPSSMTTREVAGSTFRYAKLLSLPFFGAGVVDLPPGGLKKPKNSRKMHMGFFVAKGRVKVWIGPSVSDAESEFTIGQGGFWQVPRGKSLVMCMSI